MQAERLAFLFVTMATLFLLPLFLPQKLNPIAKFCLDNRISIVLEIDHLLHFVHNLLEIPVRSADTILGSTVPGSDSFLYIVLRVMKRLNKEEHFFGLLQTVSVSQRVAQLTFPFFEDIIAILHEYRCNLHGTNRVSTHSLGVASTFYLNNRIHHWIPVES
jgi:hypothetical protein